MKIFRCSPPPSFCSLHVDLSKTLSLHSALDHLMVMFSRPKQEIKNAVFFFRDKKRALCSIMMQRCPKNSKSVSDKFGTMREMGCRSGYGQPASLLFLTKVFLPTPLTVQAWGAAPGPPDAYRQMSLVEQNMLSLTS